MQYIGIEYRNRKYQQDTELQDRYRDKIFIDTGYRGTELCQLLLYGHQVYVQGNLYTKILGLGVLGPGYWIFRQHDTGYRNTKQDRILDKPIQKGKEKGYRVQHLQRNSR